MPFYNDSLPILVDPLSPTKKYSSVEEFVNAVLSRYLFRPSGHPYIMKKEIERLLMGNLIHRTEISPGRWSWEPYEPNVEVHAIHDSMNVVLHPLWTEKRLQPWLYDKDAP